MLIKLTALAELYRDIEPDRDLLSVEVFEGSSRVVKGVGALLRFSPASRDLDHLQYHLDLTAADKINPIERGLLELQKVG